MMPDKQQATTDNFPAPTSRQGSRAALLFALVAERLATFYEHGQWLTIAQGATLSADWLSRSKLSFSLAERKQLSLLSDQLARKIESSVSRESGLYISHELTESLDANYNSEVGQSIMRECELLLNSANPDEG